MSKSRFEASEIRSVSVLEIHERDFFFLKLVFGSVLAVFFFFFLNGQVI